MLFRSASAPAVETPNRAEPDPAKEPPKAPSQPAWFFSPATTEEVLAPILETPARTEPNPAATAKAENSAKEQSKPEPVKEQVTPIVPPVLQQLRQVATALTKPEPAKEQTAPSLLKAATDLTKPDSSNNDVSSSFNSSLKKINKLKNKR